MDAFSSAQLSVIENDPALYFSNLHDGGRILTQHGCRILFTQTTMPGKLMVEMRKYQTDENAQRYFGRIESTNFTCFTRDEYRDFFQRQN